MNPGWPINCQWLHLTHCESKKGEYLVLPSSVEVPPVYIREKSGLPGSTHILTVVLTSQKHPDVCRIDMPIRRRKIQ